jgi:gamma-glutamyltranspeptidase
LGGRHPTSWQKPLFFILYLMTAIANHDLAQDRSQARSMVVTRYGIVAAENPIAAQVGASILADGGNAVDAAIATNAMMGLEVRGNYSPVMGGGQAVLRDYSTGINDGASDPRKDGAAVPEPTR